MELIANSSTLPLFGAAREKWPQLEQVIFIVLLLKMLRGRVPVSVYTSPGLPCRDVYTLRFLIPDPAV